MAQINRAINCSSGISNAGTEGYFRIAERAIQLQTATRGRIIKGMEGSRIIEGQSNVNTELY